jgi:predicted RNA-binding Zn ribbon-like protein
VSEPTPLKGERVALDLVNTLPLDGGRPRDLLATTVELRSWLGLQADRLLVAGVDEGGLAAADLDAVHAVRKHAATVIDHARRRARPPAAGLDALNLAQRIAPAVRELAWGGAAVTVVRRRTGPLGFRVAAALADAVAELVADPAVGGIRECAAPDCVMLFLSANPRRTWCSSARCGNRVRVARHYQRRRRVT